MNKLNNFIIIATCLLLFLSNNNQLFAGGEDVKQWQGPHKHLVREAYKRLYLDLGYDIPELKRHLGNDENGSGPFKPGGSIVIGAFREDEEDIVYGYKGPDGAYISNTHFWKADDGDYVLTTFPSIISIIGSFPNALEKTKKYINGEYNFNFESVTHSYAPPSPSLSLPLFDYYKSGYIKKGGTWQYHNRTQIDKVVWEIVGRMCHLLADVNTPAHVKNDPHFPPWFPAFGKYDFYEHEMDARRYQYTAQTAKNYGSLVPIHYTHPSIPNDKTLKILFYTSAQIADHFSSDDGRGNDNPASGDPFTNYYVGVNSSGNFITLQQKFADLPYVSNKYINSVNRFDINVEDVAKHCFHYTINATASFLLWCANEMNIMPFVVPLQYPTIESAVQAAASSNRTVKDVVVTSGTYTFNTGYTLPDGVNINFLPNVTINLANDGFIKTTGTGRIYDEGATWISNNLADIIRVTNNDLDVGMYATLESAINNLASNNVIELSNEYWGHVVNQPVTIPGGSKLTIKPGSNINFRGGLTVNGSLDVRGATLDFGSSTLPYKGLIINGSIYCIYSKLIGGTIWSGVTINYGNYPIIIRSDIIRGEYGITLNGGNIRLDHTVISSWVCGMRFTNGSRGEVFSNNVFEPFSGGDIDIDASSNPHLGSDYEPGDNSFRALYGVHLVSLYPGKISAQHNYWKQGPPTQQNVNYTPYNPYDINPSIGSLGNDYETEIDGIFLKKTIIKNDKPVEKVPGIEELDQAVNLFYSKKYDEALPEMYRLVDEYKDGFVGKRALVFIEDILVKTNRAKEILPMLERYSFDKSKVAQYASYRQAYQYIHLLEYDKAIEIMKSMKFSEEDADLKQARLYELGVAYHDLLGKKVEAYNYFSELVKSYPDCPLADVAKTFYKITKDGYGEPKEEKEISVPIETKLFANYPNPFNPSTVIKYQLADAAQISLKVYDVMGREVATLVNTYQNKGSYEVTFNANGLASGIYFYKLNAGGKQLINKMLLMK